MKYLEIFKNAYYYILEEKKMFKNGSVESQVRCGSEQLGLVEAVPSHRRAVGTRWCSNPFQPQLFYLKFSENRQPTNTGSRWPMHLRVLYSYKICKGLVQGTASHKDSSKATTDRSFRLDFLILFRDLF